MTTETTTACPQWCETDHDRELAERRELHAQVAARLTAETGVQHTETEVSADLGRMRTHDALVGVVPTRCGRGDQTGLASVRARRYAFDDGEDEGGVVIVEPDAWVEWWSPDEARALAASLLAAADLIDGEAQG